MLISYRIDITQYIRLQYWYRIGTPPTEKWHVYTLRCLHYIQGAVLFVLYLVYKNIYIYIQLGLWTNALLCYFSIFVAQLSANCSSIFLQYIYIFLYCIFISFVLFPFYVFDYFLYSTAQSEKEWREYLQRAFLIFLLAPLKCQIRATVLWVKNK